MTRAVLAMAALAASCELARVTNTAATMGGRPGGRIRPMSLAVSAPLEPVLSPMAQPLGRPARRRSAPVVLAASQAWRRSREAGFNAAPRVNFSKVAAMAAGVGGARGSPVMA